MTDEKDARIEELEERLKKLEDWAHSTTRWMSALAQQDALAIAFLPLPKDSKMIEQYAALLGQATGNYKALNDLVSEPENGN